jgi:hypothetical protein
MKTQFNNITRAFENAPITNPNGTTGINLHIVWDSVDIDKSKVSMTEYLINYKDIHFDNEDNGYYHILVVDNACSNGECERIGGVTSQGSNGALVQTKYYSETGTANVAMHELGHMLGIIPSKYSGVDSRYKSFNQYPSVMNYNAPYNYFDYSSGTEYNGWEEINNNLNN